MIAGNTFKMEMILISLSHLHTEPFMMPRPNQDSKEPLIILMGATASGKTELALTLAETYPLEIVNADSVQVYRHLDIGSAKPDIETRRRVPHHLLDLVEPDDPFSADRYRVAAEDVIVGCRRRGTVPLFVGGSGLYFRAVERGLAVFPSPDPTIRQHIRQQGEQLGWLHLHKKLSQLDPERAAQITPGDGHRSVHVLAVYETSGHTLSQWYRQQPPPPSYAIFKMARQWPVETLYNRINHRFDQMMGQGLLEETAALLAKGYDANLPAMKAVGYRQLLAHLTEKMPLPEAVEWAKRESRRYAKRQRTWLRREPGLVDLSNDEIEKTVVLVGRFLDKWMVV